MIHIERSSQPEPAALKKLYRSGDFKGKTEAERVAQLFKEHVEANKDPVEFTFDFQRYKEPEVKTALEALFHGKCAYCESRYAGTQPMDVEHWRPKSEVHIGSGTDNFEKLPGYFWEASAWDNLLPSCVDCNRERTQTNFVTKEEKTLGKANQFPVVGDDRLGPPPTVDADPTGSETPLLLHPCNDEPADHLTFEMDGSVAALNDSEMGKKSIDVFALNRTELAIDRIGLLALMRQRLATIERLAGVITDAALPAHLQADLEELLTLEIDALEEMAEPKRPFSALAQAFLAENSPLLVRP